MPMGRHTCHLDYGVHAVYYIYATFAECSLLMAAEAQCKQAFFVLEGAIRPLMIQKFTK